MHHTHLRLAWQLHVPVVVPVLTSVCGTQTLHSSGEVPPQSAPVSERPSCSPLRHPALSKRSSFSVVRTHSFKHFIGEIEPDASQSGWHWQTSEIARWQRAPLSPNPRLRHCTVWLHANISDSIAALAKVLLGPSMKMLRESAAAVTFALCHAEHLRRFPS